MLQGKTALVTGSTSGIGLGIATVLLAAAIVLLRKKPVREIVHVSVPVSPEPDEVPVEELLEDDDMFVLEGFDDEASS